MQRLPEPAQLRHPLAIPAEQPGHADSSTVPELCPPLGNGYSQALRRARRRSRLGRRRLVVPIKMPGKAARAVRAGANLALTARSAVEQGGTFSPNGCVNAPAVRA